MNEKQTFSVITFIFFISSAHLHPVSNNIRRQCPHLYQSVFRGFMPRGNVSAGVFEEIKDAMTLKECVIKCCENLDCNVVFKSNKKCYHINCSSNELCIPFRSPDPEAKSAFEMVLVRTTDDDTWLDVLNNQESHLNRDMYNSEEETHQLEDIYKELTDDHFYTIDFSCEVGAEEPQCYLNEYCEQNFPKSRAGTCTCKSGFVRNSACISRCDCIDIDMGAEAEAHPDLLTERIVDLTNRTMPMTRKHLTVIAENKEVKLPNNEVTLNVAVQSDNSNEMEKYQFDWTSLQQPEGSTAVKHQNSGQLQLSNLVEGLYTFKVSASNSLAYGETFVNVTVLPPSRTNKPPQIIITPANQTIKQPNSAAVLDASSSTDDDGIVSWHWELQQGPLGYQPELKDSATLQLNDLTKPGNYTFKLTVTDTDKATSSAIANVTVIKFTDYPPEANAGEQQIIYLPHNKITLNGNMSSDDHAITTWEWTKSPDDAQKAVDMQDTRTPYLQLSNLEEGMYTFTLKVTDSANQSSTAQVHVFVKPPTNRPPIAKAGLNITISLPQTWIVLDGTNSTDDNKIVAFQWKQIDGPSTVHFINVNSSKTNVTNLTKGVYIFKLTVIDDNNNVANDNVYVTVNQNINQKPKANAGGDFEIELPRNVIFINGSKSKDDWAIVKWQWIRNEKSTPLGKIAENSDKTSILILTDIDVGKYIFNLTVFDEQGLSDTDIVRFNVKNDPKLYYLIEIIIDINVNYLTQLQYENLIGKLTLLIEDNVKLHVRNINHESNSNKVKITFYVEMNDGKLMEANNVVECLRQKLHVDVNLLGFNVIKLQTAICQNNCSGHGVCIEHNRKCKCEAFWMQDLFKLYLTTNEDSDCSWSILYVVLGLICLIIVLMCSIWGIVYLWYRLCSKRKTGGVKRTKTTNYKLIEDTDDIPPFTSMRNCKSNLSDSDTDSDIVFESRNNKTSRNGHHKSNRNGYCKTSRRIKT